MTPPSGMQRTRMLRTLARRAEYLTTLLLEGPPERKARFHLRERKALRWAVAELAGDQLVEVIAWARGETGRSDSAGPVVDASRSADPVLRIRLDRWEFERVQAAGVDGEHVTATGRRLLLSALERAEGSGVAVAASDEGTADPGSLVDAVSTAAEPCQGDRVPDRGVPPPPVGWREPEPPAHGSAAVVLQT